uniref:Uncharacterized protein n=1 Tax=Arundo donax TaxID=35708 RepID=A0A0A8Y9Q4_ARUDO
MFCSSDLNIYPSHFNFP